MSDSPEATPEAVLADVARLASRIPAATLETICRALESNASASLAECRQVLTSVPNPGVRRALDTALEGWFRWRREDPALSLAWALRGAGAADRWWRGKSTVELAWTGPASLSNTFRRTEEALLQVIESSHEELWLVSFAGYKVPRVRDALVEAAGRFVRINLIIESPEVSAGKVTFSALEGIGSHLAELASVYVWPREKRPKNEKGHYGTLHVKCALADERLLFVSSANLTEFAMSLNMELGTLVTGGGLPRQVARHFRWLVERRHLVTSV